MKSVLKLFQLLSCLMFCIFLIPEEQIRAQIPRALLQLVDTLPVPPEVVAEAEEYELTGEEILECGLAFGRGLSRAAEKIVSNPKELVFTVCATGIIIAFPGVVMVPGVTHALFFVTASGLLKSLYDVSNSEEFKQEYGIDPTKAILAAVGEIAGQFAAHYLTSLGTVKLAQAVPKSVFNLKMPFSKNTEIAIELNPNGYHKMGLFETKEQSWKSFGSFKYGEGLKWYKIPEPAPAFSKMPYIDVHFEESNFRPPIEYFANEANLPKVGGRIKPHDPRNFPDHHPMPHPDIKASFYDETFKMHHSLNRNSFTNFLEAPINNDPLIQKMAYEVRELIGPDEIIPGIGCREAVYQFLIRTNPKILKFPIEKLKEFPHMFREMIQLPGMKTDPNNPFRRFITGIFRQKDEGLVQGAWGELDAMKKVQEIPSYVIEKVGGRFKDSSVNGKFRDFDIVVNFKQKKLFLEIKDRIDLRKSFNNIKHDDIVHIQETFKTQQSIAKTNNADFVVLSKQPIHPSWKHWFDEQGIKWRENGEMYIPTELTPPSQTTFEKPLPPITPPTQNPPSDTHQANGLFMMPGIFGVLREDSNQAPSSSTHENPQSEAVKEFIKESVSQAIKEGMEKYAYSRGFKVPYANYFESVDMYENAHTILNAVDESTDVYETDSDNTILSYNPEPPPDRHSGGGYMDPDVYGYRGTPYVVPAAGTFKQFDLGQDYTATFGGEAFYSNEQGAVPAKGAYGKARVEGPIPEVNSKLLEKVVEYVPSAAIIAAGIIAVSVGAYLLYNYMTKCETIDVRGYPNLGLSILRYMTMVPRQIEIENVNLITL